MPTDNDLFAEEQTMVTMSFGDHIEELRLRLILALYGLVIGVVLTLVPGINLGQRIMNKMVEPAQEALTLFYNDQAVRRAEVADAGGEVSETAQAIIPADAFIMELGKIAPELKLPEAETVKNKNLTFPIRYMESGIIKIVNQGMRPSNALISLAPLETMTIFFMVCLVAGLVIASPWVFYQLWAFIAAGLYRHERHYVTKFLPFSLGLFLSGVFLCFFGVLPVTLKFLLEFNVWLGIEPTLRLADWMSFATILPLVFGVCFQTPLIMVFLALIGIFNVDDFRSKRKIAILIMVVAGAVLTPSQDPFSMLMLAVPMIILYELGILMVARKKLGPSVRQTD
ncbi:twin arginine targeting protein translocase subunit TatC [Singulisphaera acidiphila DSM 18658]|uniref:Sec-independent protein translocase protein TatC n=2 Tax=Singulisphaera acidiphila TaxID=466153 RepID=L0DLQ2_SINAD|nr:twin arginine targeting protein translocase subunit TatC [Singulisphaera acidiphila DSM 18658]